MRIIIITQNEPFYLRSSLNYLIKLLPKNHKIVGCIVGDVSPFGKKESFLEKALKTFRIFGIFFFIHYTLKFLKHKLFEQSLNSFLISRNIPNIILTSSVNSEESLNKIKSYKPDLIISILGNQIFKKKLIELAPMGCINLHTALLPKYRGLMPTFWVLKNEEKFIGVSVFFVDEGIDSGPIIVQKKIKIGNLNQSELISLTKKIGMECIAEAVEKISENKINLIPNPDSEKTYFSFPTRKDVIDFNLKGKKFY